MSGLVMAPVRLKADALRSSHWDILSRISPHSPDVKDNILKGQVLQNGSLSLGNDQATLPNLYFDADGTAVLGIVPTGLNHTLTEDDIWHYVTAIEKSPHLETFDTNLVRQALFFAYQSNSMSWSQITQLSKAINTAKRIPILQKLGLIPGGSQAVFDCIFVEPTRNGPLTSLKSDLDLSVIATKDGKTSVQNFYGLIQHISNNGYKAQAVYAPAHNEHPLGYVFPALDVMVWYPDDVLNRSVASLIHHEFGYLPSKTPTGAEASGEVIALWNKLCPSIANSLENTRDLFKAYTLVKTGCKAVFKSLKRAKQDIPTDVLDQYVPPQTATVLSQLQGIHNESIAPDKAAIVPGTSGIFAQGLKLQECILPHTDENGVKYSGLYELTRYLTNTLLQITQACLVFNSLKAMPRPTQVAFKKHLERLDFFLQTHQQRIEQNVHIKLTALSLKTKALYKTLALS
jgi:hypothetical protein